MALSERDFASARGSKRSARALRHDIFGTPDELKFRSSMTLFAALASAIEPFAAALAKYCGSEPDARTLELLG